MRTDRYRYTEWQEIKTGEVAARELYDHETDPDENENVASVPANEALIEKLGGMLHDGYRKAVP